MWQTLALIHSRVSKSSHGVQSKDVRNNKQRACLIGATTRHHPPRSVSKQAINTLDTLHLPYAYFGGSSFFNMSMAKDDSQ